MTVRHELEDAFYRYALAYDEDDLDALAACFTPDAVMSTTMNDDRAQGRDAIRALFAGRREGRRQRAEQCRHLIGNVMVLDRRGEAVLALAYNSLLTTTGDETRASVMAGWYRSWMVKDGDRWLIREHLVHVDSGERVAAVPAAVAS
jgi:uncharacterized protein (TIGR02246 family)